jgi:hypothetical protein
MAGFRDRARVFWRDFGLSEWGKEVSAAAREGRPPPPPPPEPPHSYRTCRDEFCDQEACQVYREGLEDGRAGLG